MFECVVSTNDKDVTELKVKSSFGRGGEINNIIIGKIILPFPILRMFLWHKSGIQKYNGKINNSEIKCEYMQLIKTIPIIEHVALKKKSIEGFSFVFPK